MKKIQFFAMIVISLAVFATGANAQKRPSKKPTAKKPVVPAKIISPLEVRTARDKTVTQHENVNFWIDKLGPIAEALELLDGTYAAKKPKESTLATHDARKKKFVATLRNLRDDLGLLESDFRTKTVLQKYLSSIQGVADDAAEAEDLAIAGKLVDSKQPLREALKKLTDTLAVLPRN